MFNTHKILALWFCLGVLYYSLEGVFHLFTNGGWANVLMLPIGGFCCVAVGGVHQSKRLRNLNVLTESLIGACIVTATEFVTGVILNLWLGMNIWSYKGLPLNVMGQICLPFSLIWLFLMPTAFWLEDTFRLKLWNEGSPYNLKTIYSEFFGIGGRLRPKT